MFKPKGLEMIFIVLLSIFCSTKVVQSKIGSSEDIQSMILATINETASDFEPCTEHLIRKAVFGDMIEIRRGRGYFHWCIFVREATVIQLQNPEFDKLKLENAFNNFTGYVELSNLIALAEKDFCRINNKMNECKRKGLHYLSNSEIKNKMLEELKRNVTFYNIVDNNCEHFATKLKFGVPFSSQIDAMKKLAENDEFMEIVTAMFKMDANAVQTQHSDDGVGVAEVFAGLA